MKKIRYLLFMGFFFSIHLVLFSQGSKQAKLEIKKIFAINADLSGGLIGEASPTNPVVLTVRDDKFKTIIYQISISRNTSQFSGDGYTLSKNDLGPGATYYPDNWYSTNIKEAIFALDKKYAEESTEQPYPFLQNVIDVNITVQQSGTSKLEAYKIPGIGESGVNPLFDLGHYCHEIANMNDCPCSTWEKVKSPNLSKSIDVIVAGHRGVWGSDLGEAAPENSEGAINGARGVTPVVELDVTIMHDDVLVSSHDYNLKRLSDFTGPDTDYLFNMNYSSIAGLNLRRRNETVSNEKYLRFQDVVDLLVRNDLVVLMDIKDIRAYRKGGVCVANCEYDPHTNPNAEQLIKESWLKIFKESYNIAKQKNALPYIAYKVSMEYDELKTVFTEDELSKVLFIPLIQPSNSSDALDKALAFIDRWTQKAGKQIVSVETNFTTLEAPILQSFRHNGKSYENIMHYVYDQLGLRGGLFSEEPCGPRGVVNRWADWSIKNVNSDIRGNQLDLINVPYGKIMMITSDRTDVWKQIGDF